MWTRQRDRDFDDEIESHIQLEADRLVEQQGLDPADALLAARRTFGNVTSHRERFYESSRWTWLERIRLDARYGARRLLKDGRFTLTAITTMTLCLGAALAVFAAADAVLWRPLPLPAANRLVTIHNTYPGAGVLDDGASVANYFERRGTLPPLASVSLLSQGTAIIGETGATEREAITLITREFFDTLGVRPALGRFFTDADFAPNAERGVIITSAAWRRHFNGAADVVGHFIRANGLPVRVIGVLPASFRFLSSEATIYVPLTSGPEQRLPGARHSGSNSEMIARLADGATVASAQAAIDGQNAVIERSDPQAVTMAGAGFRSVVTPLRQKHTSGVRVVLLLLLTGVFGLTAVGAANLINLVLVRTSARARETAVRAAIGAGRGALVSSILVETAILAATGAVCGVFAGAAGMQFLHSAGVEHLPLGATIDWNARVAAGGLAGALLFAFVMAVPALWLTMRVRITGASMLQVRGVTAGRAAARARQAFVAAQIAATFVLLSGSGLLGMSLFNAMQVPPGFQPGHTVTGHVTLPWQTYRRLQDRRAFAARALADLARLPGVTSVALASNVPLSGDDIKSAVTLAVPLPGTEPHGYYSYWVGGDYFGAMGVPVVAGRVLEAADSERAERVAVVDEDFVKRNFGHTSAIGRRLFLGPTAGSDAEAFTIIGVVKAVKQSSLLDQSAQGAVYFPFSAYSNNTLFLVVRTAALPGTVGSAMTRVVRAIDPELPVNDVEAMATRLDDSLMIRRSPTVVTGIFAALALLLASIGTYGVVSYAVLQRRREIALRLALGADPRQIRRQFLVMGWRLLAVGAAVGVVGAWLSGRLIQTVLFDVPALHVPTIALSLTLLGLITTVASLFPSSRAARLSPMIALQEE